MKRVTSTVLLGMGFLFSNGQHADTILKNFYDLLSSIKTFSYQATLSQVNSNKTKTLVDGKVIMERNVNISTAILFITSDDSIELIYDGKFGFEVNHKRKTVNQVDPEWLKRQPLSQIVLSDLFEDNKTESVFRNKPNFSQDKTSWVYSFKARPGNNIKKIWIAKATLLPEKILIQKSPEHELLITISNIVVNSKDVPKPGTQIARYIDTYKLLPLGEINNPKIIDGRDSLIGKPAPPFTLADFNNNQVRLSDFIGKYILLDFWEAWCGSCRMSMAHLEELYQQYHDKGFEIIGITKDILQVAKRITTDKKLSYINVVADERIKMAYKVNEIPQYYLIDPEGKIIYASKNGFEQKMEDLLKSKLIHSF
ncbi:MAG TPA: redoxin domain-containing protein [Chitinophagaceae bacterium]|nr:redoxin domain-containing protein [Chitinophagaceae bacterium]